MTKITSYRFKKYSDFSSQRGQNSNFGATPIYTCTLFTLLINIFQCTLFIKIDSNPQSAHFSHLCDKLAQCTFLTLLEKIVICFEGGGGTQTTCLGYTSHFVTSSVVSLSVGEEKLWKPCNYDVSNQGITKLRNYEISNLFS